MIKIENVEVMGWDLLLKKGLRAVTVYADITAPLYWWKEFNFYNVGTVGPSGSMISRKIEDKEFTLDDFSREHFLSVDKDKECVIIDDGYYDLDPVDIMDEIIEMLNRCRILFLETKDEKYWWQMFQLLPSSYNRKHTVMLDYEVLSRIYRIRKNHKLDEWVEFCKWIKTLPYSEIIVGEKVKLYADGPEVNICI